MQVYCFKPILITEATATAFLPYIEAKINNPNSDTQLVFQNT